MDLSAYALDGTAPSRALAPATAAAVADAVRAAHDAREALVVWGGGTRIGVGDAPSRYDAALDLRSLRGVVEHSPADLVCTVRAGTTLAELAACLGPTGQRWPVEAGDPERATVGGTIASAAAGPSRLRFQHPRDWIIGCEAVLGDGTRARAGGRVVKNVTGYDLTRLYSGTYGTLAVLVEVHLKLVATDELRRTLVLRGERAHLVSVVAALRALPLDAIALVTGDEPALYVRAGGGARGVERLVADVRRIAAFADAPDGMWADLAARPVRRDVVARLAVAPWHEAEHLDGDGLAYAGTGIAYRFDADGRTLQAARARCEAAGGALVLERAPAALRREVGVWGRTRVPASVARALKERFDPHGVLAPGRV